MSKLSKWSGVTDFTAASKTGTKAATTAAKPGFFTRLFGKTDPSLKYRIDIPQKPQSYIEIKNRFNNINSIQNLDELTNQYKLFKESLQDLDVPQQNQLTGLNDQFEKRFKTLEFNKKEHDFYTNLDNELNDLKLNDLEPDQIRKKISDFKAQKEKEFKKNILDDPNKPRLVTLNKTRFDKSFNDFETNILKTKYNTIQNNFVDNVNNEFNKFIKIDDITPDNINNQIENLKKFKKNIDTEFKAKIKGHIEYNKKTIKQLNDKFKNYEKQLKELDKKFKKSAVTKNQVNKKIDNSPNGTPQEKQVAKSLGEGDEPPISKNQLNEAKNKLSTETDPNKAYSKLKTLSLISGVAALGIAAYIIFSQSKVEVQSSTDYKIISISKESDDKTLIQYEPADTFIEGLNIQITESNSYPTVNGYYKIINPKPGNLTIDAKIVDTGDKGIIKYLLDFNHQFNYELNNVTPLDENFLDTEENNLTIPTDDSNKILGLDKTLFIIIVITIIIFILLSCGLALFSM